MQVRQTESLNSMIWLLSSSTDISICTTRFKILRVMVYLITMILKKLISHHRTRFLYLRKIYLLLKKEIKSVIGCLKSTWMATLARLCLLVFVKTVGMKVCMKLLYIALLASVRGNRVLFLVIHLRKAKPFDASFAIWERFVSIGTTLSV